MMKPYMSPYFMLAEGCNLKCSYCYEYKKKKKLMTKEVFDQGLNYMKKHFDVSSIVLFGGEPTLNEEVLNHALTSTDESLEIVLITNGVHVSDTTLDLISKRKNVSVQVSLDGTFTTMYERIQDNEALFNQIIENAYKYRDALEKSNGMMSFHTTVTKSNIGSLYENVMFLLGLNITHWINSTTDFSAQWTKQDYFLYETQFMMISDYIKENPIQGQVRSLHCQEVDSKYQYGCPAGVACSLINAEGDIYPCSRLYTNFGEQFLLGNIFNEKTIDNKLFSDLDYNQTKCGQCEINNCIRCYASNLELYGELLKVNPCHCGMSKLNLKVSKYHQ